METNINSKNSDKIDWHYILIANGFVSVILGIIALIATSVYSETVYNLIVKDSSEKFSLILRLIVLIYIAYGLLILSSGFIWLRFLSGKTDKEVLNEDSSVISVKTSDQINNPHSSSTVVTLTPELEAKLREKAAKQQQDINLVVTELLNQILPGK
jgi:hypothetical protein